MAALVLGDISAVLAAFNITEMSFTSFVNSSSSAEASRRDLIRLTQWSPVVVQALTRVMILAAMETRSAMSRNHDHGRPQRNQLLTVANVLCYKGPFAGLLFGARLSSISVACCAIAESVLYRANNSPAQANRRVDLAECMNDAQNRPAS
jgi:hypothetical protein